MWVRSVALLSAIIVLGSAAAYGQSAGRDDAGRVKRHFKIEKPANLSRAEALTIYENIGAEMAEGYAVSRRATALNYRKWRRYNSAPYRSATHGNRYVNNHVNAASRRYGKLKRGQAMPPGAVFAKDSFTVTADGGVFGSALFIMEKLAPGTSAATADWRYVMILPDGSLFGDSRGENAAGVAFCHGCHTNAASEQDHLFFVPEPYRRRFLTDPKADD